MGHPVTHFECKLISNMLLLQYSLFFCCFFLQPSSCLSDKEEDEIYGFGYGVFAPRVGRNTLQNILPQAMTSNNTSQQQQPNTSNVPGPNQQR